MGLMCVVGLLCYALLIYGANVVRPGMPESSEWYASFVCIPRDDSTYEVVEGRVNPRTSKHCFELTLLRDVTVERVEYPTEYAPYAVRKSPMYVSGFEYPLNAGRSRYISRGDTEFHDAIVAYLRERKAKGDAELADSLVAQEEVPRKILWDGVFWIAARTGRAWAIAAVPFVVGPLLSAAIGCWIVMRRQRANRCGACGYALAGLPSAKCPECGLNVPAAG